MCLYLGEGVKRAEWRGFIRWPSRYFPILSACRVEAAGLGEVWTTEIFSQPKHIRGMRHMPAVTAAHLGTIPCAQILPFSDNQLICIKSPIIRSGK